MYAAHYFGENSHYVWVTEYVTFAMTGEHHWHFDGTSHPRKENLPLHHHIFVRFYKIQMWTKKVLFSYPHSLKWCGKPPVHLGRGNIYSSPTNSPLPLCGFRQERGTLSASDSTPARASLQILYVRWMMVITVKGLGYYLFLSSRQHLTVFVYQVVIKILCLDVKLTYFITNLLLQLIMNYV